VTPLEGTGYLEIPPGNDSSISSQFF
jgi:hypothetical protein